MSFDASPTVFSPPKSSLAPRSFDSPATKAKPADEAAEQNGSDKDEQPQTG